MNKETVYVIGDCHTSRIQEHYDKSTSPINFVFWGRASKKIWDLNFEQMTLEDAPSSGHEMQNFKDEGVVNFSQIKDDGIVFSWMGYVDVRTWLSEHDNAETVVQRYMDQLSKKFKNSYVYIVEPLPQFTEMLLKYDGISPYFTHEQRLEQNKKFLTHLHEYVKKNNFKIIITQNDILECLDVKELTPRMTHNLAPHPVDGLKAEYSKKIFELFQSKAKEILNHGN